VRFITPEYFTTMAIPVLQGRGVETRDEQTSQFVAVVSRSLAERFWPGQDPIGRHFSVALDERVVVGVVGDVRVRGLERDSEPQVYLPSTQVKDGWLTFYAPKDLVVRTSGAVAPVVTAIREAVSRADPEQPVSDVRTLADIVEGQTASRSVQLSALGAFAAIAVLLACLGIHGLLSFVVASRTQEIGVRMAFGATRAAVLGLVLGRTAVLAAIGVTVGLGAAYAVSRSIQALLAGVSPADAGTFAAAAAIAFAMALAGSLVPARRAVGVDPISAIRVE
jgi:putative ABC transport system permease protein